MYYRIFLKTNSNNGKEAGKSSTARPSLKKGTDFLQNTGTNLHSPTGANLPKFKLNTPGSVLSPSPGAELHQLLHQSLLSTTGMVRAAETGGSDIPTPRTSNPKPASPGFKPKDWTLADTPLEETPSPHAQPARHHGVPLFWPLVPLLLPPSCGVSLARAHPASTGASHSTQSFNIYNFFS